MIVTIVLLHNDNMFQTTITPGKEVSIGSHKKDNLIVPEFAPQQICIKWKNDGISVNAQKAYGFEKDNIPLNTSIILNQETRTALFLSSETSDSSTRIRLPYNCILKFGRTNKNDVMLKFPFISEPHFVLKSENGNIRVEDAGSTNGLYLNGKKISIAKMKSGDILSILSINIRLTNGELGFSNVGNNLFVCGKIDAKDDNQVRTAVRSAKLVYKRSPRTQDSLPNEDIVLSNAPSKAQKYEKGRGMFSSLAGSGAMFATSMLTAAASPALLAARAASLVSPVASVASSGSSNKKRKKSIEQYEAMRREKYGAYIADQKARIESVAKVQRDILTKENPEPRECINTLYGLRRNLWERMPTDRDFLDVRVGMGYEDLCVKVKTRQENNSFQMEDDEIRELSEQIIEETRIVDNVPARISLLQNNTIGFIGDRQKAIRLLRNMLISLTTTHSFEDVKIIGIFDRSEMDMWQSLKWLPHIWGENHQSRYLAFDKESAHNLFDSLNDVLKKRREELRDKSFQGVSIPNPYYVLIVGSKELVAHEEIMNNLFCNDVSMGITSLFLFDDIYNLPHDCRFIVDMNNGPCAFDRYEANKKFYFTMDGNIEYTQLDSFARRMSAIELDGLSSKSGLPNGITFMQGYNAETVDQLQVIDKWNSSIAYKSLAAPIGVMASGKPFCLDIHEKAHGPHGLVAGTTGSGKSELLQTWILSMAICFHPYDVSFVIIDYKGGGMANLLEPLPHVVGKITNIGSNIARSLISLQSEIKRRQRIFDTYGVNHIDKYQKLFKEGKGGEPLPHLIIVADEFAELKKEEPEFMAGLISASRVGRSLGIHLVLATQKPGGVVDDQIQSNSRFRLCLKVQDVNDSREMIKRPDAAKITQAGRSYVRVGEDEYFDLFQSYWSGAPYMGAKSHDRDIGNQVRIVDLTGRRIKPVADKRPAFKSDTDELTAIVQHVCSVAKENGIDKLQGPWLPELPENLYLNSINSCPVFDGQNWNGTQKWLSVPIGMFDSPKEQTQGVISLDLASEGHFGIYGAPGTGKTTLLKTIVYSLGLNYSPKDVNIYILDCGGWSMTAFSNMPHVGGVALDCEAEKFTKFESLIMGEFEARKRKFVQNSVSSLSAYRESVSDDMPAIVIAIDNIVPIFDLYPDLENLFVTIARDGATYGIYLVYTANSTTGVRYKVLQNIRGAIAFELTDKGDYAALVGRLDGMSLPKITGRAFFKGNPPIEFQAAQFAEGKTDREKTLSLQDTVSQMNRAWDGPRPKPIPVMPDEVTMENMTSEYSVRTIIPVGICYENIGTSYVDLTDNYSMLISGSIQSGKSAVLLKMVNIINSRFPETKVFVFDGLKKSLAESSAKTYKYCVVDDEQSVSDMLNELVEYLNVRKRAQNQSRQIEGDSFSEKQFIASYEMLCIVIDDLKEFVEAVSDASKNSMERICRLAQDLGVIVIAAGRLSDISKLNEIESLTRVIVSNQNGLVIDGTPAQYTYFQNNLKYSEREIEAGEGNGYLFINGKCSKIKMLK